MRRIMSARRPTTRGNEVRRDGGQRSEEAESVGRGKLAAQASGGRPSRANSHSQGGQRKKVVSPSARRRAVKMSVQEGLGKVVASCRALGLSRSSYYRSGRSSLESRRIRREVLELSGKHPRYGYRRITALMRRDGVRGPMRNEWRGFGEKKESR